MVTPAIRGYANVRSLLTKYSNISFLHANAESNDEKALFFRNSSACLTAWIPSKGFDNQVFIKRCIAFQALSCDTAPAPLLAMRLAKVLEDMRDTALHCVV